jgi:hypothetical protein
MANIGQYAYLNMLNWSLKSIAAPATPANVYVGLSLTAPTYQSTFEVATGSGYARQSMAFATAATAAGSASASNSTAGTFGPFSSSAVVTGLFLADTVSSGTGNLLWYGNLSAARTPLVGDSLVLAAGALAITLN